MQIYSQLNVSRAGWVKLADVGRSGDKSERFRLYRKDK